MALARSWLFPTFRRERFYVLVTPEDSGADPNLAVYARTGDRCQLLQEGTDTGGDSVSVPRNITVGLSVTQYIIKASAVAAAASPESVGRQSRLQ